MRCEGEGESLCVGVWVQVWQGCGRKVLQGVLACTKKMEWAIEERLGHRLPSQNMLFPRCQTTLHTYPILK